MKLKPCPFCGSDRVYYTETEEQNYTDHVEGFIWCHGCNFTSDAFLDPEIAAEKWNRRANDVRHVVRCRDCIHFQQFRPHDGFCKIDGMLWNNDFFCANGENKEES